LRPFWESASIDYQGFFGKHLNLCYHVEDDEYFTYNESESGSFNFNENFFAPFSFTTEYDLDILFSTENSWPITPNFP